MCVEGKGTKFASRLERVENSRKFDKGGSAGKKGKEWQDQICQVYREMVVYVYIMLK